ncbi:LysM peptidoglycan-binding domain-containing protein [Velocimicrobium porci]|nr:LysM peptidoglycan-binding domain-containing protein [Velocimicrobium porci]
MRKKITFTLIMIFFTALFITLFIISEPAIASFSGEKEKVIICVEIKEGDTLWKIAEQYYTDDYKTMNLYIREIKKCNGITEHIKVGQKILIPHYITT